MVQKFIEELKKHTRVLIISHIRPDGDAIGSQIGLTEWFKANQIEVKAVNHDELPDNLQWLNEDYVIIKPEKSHLDWTEAIIFIDGNSPQRFGNIGEIAMQSGKPVYVIDHHPGAEPIYHKALIVDTASSTAELIFHLFLHDNIKKLTTRAAKAIYTGIITDTGSFRFDSVTPNVHTIASELLRYGQFNPSEVHEKIFDRRSFSQLRLLSGMLATTKTHFNGKIATIELRKELLAETGCTYADADGFISYPMSLDGVIAAVLFAEIEGKIKLSLRSKRYLDVNTWARNYGGGGHKRASGAWFEKHNDLEKAIVDVIEKGIELYDESIT